jgi:hypothetical protein
MKESVSIRLAAAILLLAALGFIAVGSGRTYEVLPDEAVMKPPPPIFNPSQFGQPPFGSPEWKPPPDPPKMPGPMLDYQLVENATFTGVVRKEGRLYYTYDPTKPRGKRSCPT